MLAQIPTTFTFEDVNHELLYGHDLSMEVFLANGSKPGLLRKVSLLYDSSEKPSSVKVIFAETDNIQFDYVADPEDGLIIPGGSVKYVLNITSGEYDDEVSVDVLEDKEGDWDVTVIEDKIDIYFSDKLPPKMDALGRKDKGRLVIIINKEYLGLDKIRGPDVADNDMLKLAELIDHEWTEHMTFWSRFFR